METLTWSEQAQIRRMYWYGYQTTEIAKFLDVSQKLVLSYRPKRVAEMVDIHADMAKKKKMTDQDWEALLDDLVGVTVA